MTFFNRAKMRKVKDINWQLGPDNSVYMMIYNKEVYVNTKKDITNLAKN